MLIAFGKRIASGSLQLSGVSINGLRFNDFKEVLKLEHVMSPGGACPGLVFSLK